MKVKCISLDDFNPAPYNPRLDLKPGDSEYEKLKKSIEEFGFLEPLVVNERTGHIISGHQRVKILKAQGIVETEAVVVDFSLEKEKAANLALNKIKGDWDKEKLALLLEDLQQIPEFDTSLTGFEVPEISQILDDYQKAQEEDDFDSEGEVDNIKEPITKSGDLIQIGPHRILCGDSAKPEDIKRLMKSDKAHLFYCDPPYLAFYIPGNRPGIKKRKKNKGTMIKNDNIKQDEYEMWLAKVISNIKPYLASGSPIYIWNGFRQFGPMADMLIKQGFHVSNVITWVKPSIAISFSDYSFQSEFCLYGWLKGNSGHNWYGSTKESNIWQVRRDLPSDRIHQNQKPIELAQRAIKNSSKRDDIVLDLFLGSGSTLIGAQSLGRRCFGIEIDPKYCDAIIRRYIAYVGRENVAAKLVHKYLKEEAYAGK